MTDNPDDYISDHLFQGLDDNHCGYVHPKRIPAGQAVMCNQPRSLHANPGSPPDFELPEPNPYEGKSLEELSQIMESEEFLRPGKRDASAAQEMPSLRVPFRGKDQLICPGGTSSRIDRDHDGVLRHLDGSFCGHEGPDRRLPVRAADAAQYVREPIPEEQRGQIRVRLLNATPDPLGSIAALGKQYKGEVVRSLSEVTDAERRSYLEDFSKTVLNGSLEAAQFHWQIEGVTRSITHQMVRSRASFFAQESLRFAVPEGNWAEEIPLPPSLAGREAGKVGSWQWNARRDWENTMGNLQQRYKRLIELGMPAEEARGVLPHDMPTRIHWVCDLRTLLAEAGKRTCTQAQFPWRVIFAGMANELRRWGGRKSMSELFTGVYADGWEFDLIASKLRPVCYQTGSCGFMAEFDRSCSIRSRVDANSRINRPSAEWSTEYDVVEGNPIVAGVGPETVVTSLDGTPVFIGAIRDAEWAADPSAARS